MSVSILAFALGGAAWTAAEYTLHRFVGHGPKREPAKGLRQLTPSGLLAAFNAEHLAHHTDPSYFAPTSRKLAAAAALAPVLAAGPSLLFGAGVGVSFALGFLTVYGGYEVVHRRIHTHGPRGPYSAFVRRHHLLHHYRSPRHNHGVLAPLWDHVFGTHVPSERVRVPEHMAMPWMLDHATGALRPELADSYELLRTSRGSRAAAQPA